jgi:hypothetical protein
MVSVQRRQPSLSGCCMRTERSVQAEGGSHGVIGESRLGAWEAVVFGAPHVESALALAQGASLLAMRAIATETSVAMLALLE